MRKILLTTVLAVLIAWTAQAQNTNFIQGIGISFQGYARDAEGAALSSKEIQVKFAFHIEGSSNAAFTEQMTLTTDPYGIFSAVIGANNDDFKKLDFASKRYSLKAFVNGNLISDSPLNSVPYAQAAGNGVPVGSMMPFAGPSEKIPDGWLLCDGSSLSRTDYPLLFDAIGTAWGEPDANHFNLPETRGYFLRGVDGGIMVDPDADLRFFSRPGGNDGNKVGSKQGNATSLPGNGFRGVTSEDGAHSHTLRSHNTTNIGNNAKSGGDVSAADNPEISAKTTSEEPDHSHTVTIDRGGDHETRPKNVYVNYIIRVK